MKLSHATSRTLVANQKQLPHCLLQAVWTTRLEFNKACRIEARLKYDPEGQV